MISLKDETYQYKNQRALRDILGWELYVTKQLQEIGVVLVL